MLRINWAGGRLNVTRVVFGQETPKPLARSLRELADRHGLRVAGAESVPEEGDLWLGTCPRFGWGEAPPTKTGWAPGSEAYLALAQLRQSAGCRK